MEEVFNSLNAILKNPKFVLKDHLNTAMSKNNEQQIRLEIEENGTKIKKYYEDVDMLYDEFINERDSNLKQIIKNKIEERRDSAELLQKRSDELKEILKSQIELNRNTEEILDYLNSIKNKNIFELTKEEQIIFLNRMIKKIVIHKDSFEILYKFEKDDEGGGNDGDLGSNNGGGMPNKSLNNQKTSKESNSLLAAVSSLVDWPGLEPGTFALRGRCSTNGATNPNDVYICFLEEYKNFIFLFLGS